MARTFYFATDRPGVLTMVGTSDPEYIKRLEGFCEKEKISEVVDNKNRTVVTLKKSLSVLNEAVDKTEEEDQTCLQEIK